MSWAFDYRPSKPRATDKGIKARRQRGKAVDHWWAERWLAALEGLMNPGRLARGRRYARSGQVLDLTATKHGVAARVQGSRPRPYNVTIDVAALPATVWETVFDALAEQAVFAADLLAGQMPPEIESVFLAAGASLFPDEPGELDAQCSCPDWDPLCKHIAATYYLLAERMDDDPFLLLRLRGRDRDAVLTALRARQGDEAEDDEPAEEATAEQPLADMLDCYWRAGAGLDRIETRLAPPPVPMPVLKRLGPPAFTDVDLERRLAGAYAAMTAAAMAVDAGQSRRPAGTRRDQERGAERTE